MKTRTLFAVILLAAPLHTFAQAASAPAAVNATFVDPDAKEAAEIRAVGDAAINRLAFTLVNELNTALSKGTLESAVDVAHFKTLPMTGDRVTGLPRIKAIKRTSVRVRSGANAPDAADQLALDRVLADLGSPAGPPKILVQRIDTPGAAPEWRVYRPLGAAPVCIKCHGNPAELPETLRAKLGSLYPADQASGYQVGEWRGLLRVTVDNPPPPPPPPPAKAAPKKK